MNTWQKAVTFISALLCILAVIALCRLASKTTEDTRHTSKEVVVWPPLKTSPPPTGDQGDAMKLLMNLLPLLTAEGLKISDTLIKLNQSKSVVPNQLLLSFKTPEALEAFRRRAAAEGLTVLNSDPRLLSAQVSYKDPNAMAQELAKHAADYDNIGPNYIVWVPGIPNQTTQPQTDTSNAGGRQPFDNSGMEAIGATADRSTWGKGVKLAILDTGVTDHPSLSNVEILHYDLVKDGQTPNGHGTAMASLAVGSGVQDGGAAQASTILDIRVADPNGESDTGLVAEAIMQAVDLGARVINISLGTTGDSLMLGRAVQYAESHGVVIVAAAGNEQRTTLAYPAGYPGVISVGAVDAAGDQAYFSNSGDNLTIVAPGVGIVSAYSQGRTVIGSGTSQATAITSGVVSTLLGWGYPPQGMTQTLTGFAKPTGAPKQQVGAGIVQLPQR